MKGTGISVLVFAEPSAQGIQPVSLQLAGKGRQLADRLDSNLGVILLGHDLDGLAERLVAAGADAVFLGDSPALLPYQQDLYVDTVLNTVLEVKPEILLFGSTFIGRELAPLIAGKLGTGLTAHCIDLGISPEGILEQHIPAYGGMITIVCPKKRPQMATVASGVFPNPVPDPTRSGRIIPLEIPKDFPLRAETVEIVRTESREISLESASIVVAGGAGAGDLNGWNQVAELAQALGAGLACTRPAVDAGWAALETMIGQSGKMVNPRLYIGVGVSGELQHMVGITGANLMIAINSDPKAPVFKQVDYGVVEDCREFVPALVKAIRDNPN